MIKANPALAWTMLGAIFLHIPLGAGNFRMVWMERERGFELAEIQSLYGLIYIIFGTAGTFLGGFLSDWYQSRWKGGRIRFLAILMLAVAPLDPSLSLCLAGFADVFYRTGFRAV